MDSNKMNYIINNDGDTTKNSPNYSNELKCLGEFSSRDSQGQYRALLYITQQKLYTVFMLFDKYLQKIYDIRM